MRRLILIDSNNEILRFSGAETGPYSSHRQARASLSALCKIIAPSGPMAVRKALAEKRTVVNENLTIRIDGKPRSLTLIVELTAAKRNHGRWHVRSS
jgi:hypothetical protein